VTSFTLFSPSKRRRCYRLSGAPLTDVLSNSISFVIFEYVSLMTIVQQFFRAIQSVEIDVIRSEYEMYGVARELTKCK